MKVVLKRARLSFPRLAEPEAFEGGEPKYKATFIITDPNQITGLKRAVAAVGKERFGEKFASGIRGGKLKNPIKYADEETLGYPEGSAYIRTTAREQPGMVAVWRGADGKPARVDSDQFYAGCYVNASLWCSAYDMPANKGVTFYLNNIQFVEDGERLDNRIAAEDEFEADESAEAPLEDLDEVDGDGDPLEDLDEDEDEDDEAPEPALKRQKGKAVKPAATDLEDLL